MHILYLELVLARVIEEGGTEGEGQSSVCGWGASERASCVCMHGRVIVIIDIYIVWHPVTFHL